MAAAEPVQRCSLFDELLGEYRNWLVARALSPDTIRGYTRLARPFIADRLGAESLTGADVRGSFRRL